MVESNSLLQGRETGGDDALSEQSADEQANVKPRRSKSIETVRGRGGDDVYGVRLTPARLCNGAMIPYAFVWSIQNRHPWSIRHH